MLKLLGLIFFLRCPLFKDFAVFSIQDLSLNLIDLFFQITVNDVAFELYCCILVFSFVFLCPLLIACSCIWSAKDAMGISNLLRCSVAPIDSLALSTIVFLFVL